MDKVTIRVSREDGLGLKEALALLAGKLSVESLSTEQKNYISGKIDAQALELILEKNGRYQLEETPIVITRPCVIEGNGSVFIGSDAMGAIVMSSNVSFRNLCFDHFRVCAAIVNQSDGRLRNISFLGCAFKNCSKQSVSAGSTQSNGIIEDIRIDHCDFCGAEAQFDDSTGGTCMIGLQAATLAGMAPVNNCLLENVWISNCHFHGKFRIAVQVFCGVGDGLLDGNLPLCSGNEVRNIQITGNVIENSFDAAINIIAASLNQTAATVHDLKISGNKIKHGIWGIYMTGCEPVIGCGDNGKVYNVEISDNELEPTENVGEITVGIAIQAGRIDYFDGTSCLDSSVENVKMVGNTLRKMDQGIFISGADILFDAPDNLVKNCRAENITVENNAFRDVKEVVVIAGSQHEGRRVDWQIGYPPHEKVWGELLENDDAITCKTCDNYVKGVTVRKNQIDGYRYKYRVSGLYGLGQGTGCGNFCEDILFEENQFERGEGRISVKNVFVDDRLHDGGGNEVKNIQCKKQ